MKASAKTLLLTCLVVLSALLGCSKGPDESPPAASTPPAPVQPPEPVVVPPAPSSLSMTLDTLPRMDSSTSAQPLAMTVACSLLSLDAGWVRRGGNEQWLMPVDTSGLILDARSPGKVTTSGTHGAWSALIRNEADLILVAREPSEDELYVARELKVDLDFKPVALDAFVFLVNDLNPVDSLTLDQIRSVYSGSTALWTQVGRKAPRDLPDLVAYLDKSRRSSAVPDHDHLAPAGAYDEIRAYQRNRNSGSQELMLRLVMKDIPISAVARSMIGESMSGPFNYLSTDPNGIGFTVYFYEKNIALPRDGRNLGYGGGDPRPHKVIAINGVAPATDTLASRAYPLTTEVYVAVRADAPADSPARKLADYLLTPEGQQIVAASGYVPMTTFPADSQNPPSAAAQGD